LLVFSAFGQVGNLAAVLQAYGIRTDGAAAGRAIISVNN